ncbi:hypothetical protein MNB_SV-6-414 [hydrothermal vent metagenome]|uniref:Uncharacterized protein n=1 Tax=hydrothermal vent metagenome TaxID=652676 RepID=A0A1W1B9E9_9ZZZZ
MSRDELRKSYPKLFDILPEDTTELRYILVIDENFNDVDSDEFDAIDPEDFNYLVYMTELLQESIGSDLYEKLSDRYAQSGIFEDFYDAGDGLFGVMTKEGEDGIAKIFLSEIERSL